MTKTQQIPEYPLYGNKKTGERFDRNKGFKVPVFTMIPYQDTLRYVANILRQGKKVCLYGYGPTHGARAIRVANTMVRADLKVTKLKAEIKESVVLVSFVVEGVFEFQERERAIQQMNAEKKTDVSQD